jgi:Tol biopolymer transport system component/O-antigen ligase
VTTATQATQAGLREHDGWKVFVLGATAACLAWLLAQVGLKIAFAGIAGITFVCTLLLVRERERLTLFVGVLSMVAILHKSFSGVEHVSSGPPSLYVNSVDVIVMLLYGMWFATGSLRADLHEQFRRPVIWLPLVAIVFTLPSLLVASSPALSVAEIVRMVFEWLVFVYVAARVRRRSDVWLILSALATIVVIEFVVVVGQWLTHSPLGLSFLGTPVELNQRITDSQSLGRPFGTITHPVFMAAFLGPLALLGLCLAVNLRRPKQKAGALLLAGLATAPMAISHTRSAALGLAIAVVVVVAASLVSRRLQLRVFCGWVFVVLVGCAAFANQLLALYQENFHTKHFSLEVDARGQLYSLGWRMFDAHPLFGTGLNNFQQVMEDYNPRGLIFDGNPVHNLFLLQASETGVVGFIALLVAGLPVLFVAIRTARSKDRLYSAVGTAVAAMFVFFVVEELFVFSLRQDHPRTLFWLLSGLVVACSRLITQPEAQGEAFGEVPPPTARPPRLARRTPARMATRSNRDTSGDRRLLRLHAARGAAVRRATSLPGRAAHSAGQFVSAAGGVATRSLPAVASASTRPLRLRAAGRASVRRATSLMGRAAHSAGPFVTTTRGAATRSLPAVASASTRPLRGAMRGRVPHTAGSIGTAGTSILVLVLVAVLPFPGSGRAADGSGAVTKILFSAQDRSPDSPMQLVDATGIYEADPDGTHVHEIVGHDGMQYSWAKWAMNGTRIVFAAHPFGTNDPDQLYLMDAEGSNRRQLSASTWVNGQPGVSPDGRSVVFTSTWPEFPKFGVYRMDLGTLQVTNLSAVGSTAGALDADPRWSSDGSHITFASSQDRTGQVVPTQIWTMRADGTHRVQESHDGFYNTDPQLSPDGHRLAWSSYRGPGVAANDDTNKLQAKLFDWFIVVHDRSTGVEHTLNRGDYCAIRPVEDPCGPNEGAAYNPAWSPDGGTVAYVSLLSRTTSCICATDADGGDPRVIIATTKKIQYFDWAELGDPPNSAVAVGSHVSPTGLLFAGSQEPGETAIFQSRSDRWGATAEPVPGFLTQLATPHWSDDRSKILFSAAVPQSRVPAPPDAPAGQHRIRHYTLGFLNALKVPHQDRSHVDMTQTFVMDAAGGGYRELTTGSTEDWHDAIPDGEWRGNVQPDMSPDGRYVVVVNLSSTTSESFLLRIDLKTGDVYNLTNATAGAVAVTDFNPRFSPNGKQIAFATMVGGKAQIATISAKTGRSLRKLTNDTYFNVAPTWSPDGRYVVYASYRGSAPIQGDPTKVGGTVLTRRITQDNWYLVRVDTRTGAKRVLTSAADSPTFSPVYSPDGSQIAYISLTDAPAQPDIYLVPSAGGPSHPLQVTLRTKELSLDWK